MRKSLISAIDQTHLEHFVSFEDDFTLVSIWINQILPTRWAIDLFFEVDGIEYTEVVVSYNKDLIGAYLLQERFEDGYFGFSCWDEVIEKLFKEIDIDSVLANLNHSNQMEYVDCNEKHLGMI